ncbi:MULTISPECIES: class I SAM-dependent methyltransferase [Amniculibacterium]|uniref:class I SAM-dependent methyltransferase n=1 Tax=Amniculibacterium TaxID=2715289 RepID=UPI000F5A6CF4|nr:MULTISPECIES: class I SAM-dependent methyltransferase [Amniculibacterium]
MSSEKGFWVLSKLGKKVLRPGGKELTEKLIEALDISNRTKVVEFAPGKGFTTQLLLSQAPFSYFGIDIEAQTISELKQKFPQDYCKFLQSSAAYTGLENQSANAVVGEAMLTMQVDHRKTEIISEAFRILAPGGRYAIHELGLEPEDLGLDFKKNMLKDLSKAGRVNARPLTQTEWVELLEQSGFRIVKVIKSPMLLLEPKRLIADEGVLGLIKIVFRLLTQPNTRQHVMEMKRVFRKYSKNLIAIAVVAEKPNLTNLNS